MSQPTATSQSRRVLLRHLVATAAGVAVGLPLLGRSSPARAATLGAASKPGTASKSALQYQGKPQGSSACVNCANFLPGESADAPGRCTIVAGDISPQGWCLAYAAKG